MLNTSSLFPTLILAAATIGGCGGQVLDLGETDPYGDAPGGSAGAGGTKTGAGGTKTGAGGTKTDAGGSDPGAAGATPGGAEAGEGGAPPVVDDLEPIRVIGGSDDAEGVYQDFTVIGVQLDDYEGKVVTVRLGRANIEPMYERLGSGQARIEDAVFQLQFPLAVERDLYKQKLVYIDANDDGVCTPDVDPVFGDWAAYPPLVMYVAPEAVNGVNMTESFSPEQDCAVFNGPWPTE